MSTFSTPDITASLMRVQAHQQSVSNASLVSESDKTKLKEKSKEFESFFVYQMMEMMKTETNAEFGGGVGEDLFRQNLNEQMANNIADAGGVGIASSIYAQLLKNQEQRAASMAAAAAYAKQ